MDWLYIKKAIISATISLGGSAIVILGSWVSSGNFDTKILGISLATSLGSWLIAIGKILGQQNEASK